MSFAVIKTGGKQYKVKSGEILKIEKLTDIKANSKIEFNEILAYGDDSKIEIGAPMVSGAKVEADLIKNSKNRTVLIFKKRRRHNSRRKNGHLLIFSRVLVINLGVNVFIGFTEVLRSFGGPFILKLTPKTPSPVLSPTKIFPNNGILLIVLFIVVAGTKVPLRLTNFSSST